MMFCMRFGFCWFGLVWWWILCVIGWNGVKKCWRELSVIVCVLIDLLESFLFCFDLKVIC